MHTESGLFAQQFFYEGWNLEQSFDPPNQGGHQAGEYFYTPQGIVGLVTCVRCGGIYNDGFIANSSTGWAKK